MTTKSTPRTAARDFSALTDEQVLDRFLELAAHTNRVSMDRPALAEQAALKAELNRRHA